MISDTGTKGNYSQYHFMCNENSWEDQHELKMIENTSITYNSLTIMSIHLEVQRN